MSVRVNRWHANHAETDVLFMGSWSSGWPGQDASGHRAAGVVGPFAPRVGAGPDPSRWPTLQGLARWRSRTRQRRSRRSRGDSFSRVPVPRPVNTTRPTCGGDRNVGRVEFTDSAYGQPARKHACSGWGTAPLGILITRDAVRTGTAGSVGFPR